MTKSGQKSMYRTISNFLNTEIRFRSNVQNKLQTDALRIYKKWQRSLKCCLHEKRSLNSQLSKAIANGKFESVTNLASQLAKVMDRLQLLSKLGSFASCATQTIAFSSVMLRDSFQYCVQRPEEGMHFIVGIEHDGVLIGTHIVPFPYESRSTVGAAGKHEATHQICIEAHETGHKIIALVHSHPGSGIGSNHPSVIDRKTQTLWEHGRKIVGGIWSRDGYLRWYSNNFAFEIDIVGNHIKRIDGNVWKIETEKIAVCDTEYTC